MQRLHRRLTRSARRYAHLLRSALAAESSASTSDSRFDVVVIGGGHAGCESAAAAVRCGARTLLITQKLDSIGVMPCNPRFGGLGKGHLMRELDALDGVSPRNCDQSAITFQALNRSHGPAVIGLRAQIDRHRYPKLMQAEIVHKTPNLHVVEAAVEDLIVEEATHPNGQKRISGCLLADGTAVHSDAVVVTTGTFLGARLFRGSHSWPGGRRDEAPSDGLSRTFHRLGLELGRFRTGTSPRLAARTIDFSQFGVLPPDRVPEPFSFMTERVWLSYEQQLPTYVGNTNATVARLIHENIEQNTFYITSDANGPRFCPSLEAKVMRFPELSHRLFLEYDSIDADVVYVQGLSMTFDETTQLDIIRAIKGLESAEIIYPGYGVLYEYVNPKQLTADLAVKAARGLYLAGQIAGTTGYEEAAVQGVVAGINAAHMSRLKRGDSQMPKDPFTLDRSQAYIGVLIDDLTSLGTTEPYRMFTSRAEFRLHLRPDNADLRLTELAHCYGAVSPERYAKFVQTRERFEAAKEALESANLPLHSWSKHFSVVQPRSKMRTAHQLLSTHKITLRELHNALPDKLGALAPLMDDEDVARRLLLDSTYAQQHERLQSKMATFRQELQAKLPDSLEYRNMQELSLECREKLDRYRPANLAAASRIEGITPDALISLLRHVKRSSMLEAHA